MTSAVSLLLSTKEATPFARPADTVHNGRIQRPHAAVLILHIFSLYRDVYVLTIASQACPHRNAQHIFVIISVFSLSLSLPPERVPVGLWVPITGT